MNVDRYMVNLFLEIRRNIPTTQAKSLKLADPNLGDTMVELYQNTTDENIRLLTELFLERAGDDWLKKANPRKAAKLMAKLKSKVTQESSAVSSEQTDEAKSSIKKDESAPRYYRGALVSGD